MAATIVATHERVTAAERILRAAVALFRERGHHGSSMRALARVFRGLLASGARAGVFQVSDVRLTAMAILTMCTGVATWFSDGGRLAPEAIADRYVEMIMRSVKR